MANQSKIIAVYVRISSAQQKTDSQEHELKRWIQSQDNLGTVKWYIDKASGKTMDRKNWNKLQSDIDSNKVCRLITWRLDRLGRTASGLTRLFEELRSRKVHFESVKDKIDLNTVAGRLIANVLASVAAYETEVRAERVKAGQAAAKAQGKHWGGSKIGCLHKYTPEQVRQIVKMKADGERISTICKTVNANRPSVYRILKRVKDGDLKVA